MTTDLLRQFVGRWRGTGRGDPPTRESFAYTDEMTIIATHEPTLLQYEQRTIAILPDGDRAPSHLELGFIRLREDGAIEWTNVQSGGRVEVLVGAIHTAEDGTVVLALNQTLLGNDAPMKDSARAYQISGDLMAYRQEIAPQAQALQLHMAATLRRMPLMMS